MNIYWFASKDKCFLEGIFASSEEKAKEAMSNAAKGFAFEFQLVATFSDTGKEGTPMRVFIESNSPIDLKIG